jgi:superfamily II DNA or RNA helicase
MMKNEPNDVITKMKTFNDVYDLTKSLSNKEKGDIFEKLTYYVFLLHPNYKNITKEIWLYNDIPGGITIQFNLPFTDKGIDLLLKTVDSEYYPIQCKFRSDKDVVVSWSELSTFAGQAYVKNFGNAIYVTNTCDIDEEILKSSKMEILQNDFFKNLDSEFFDNVRRCIQKNKIMIKIKSPFDYQTECNDKVQKYYFNKEADIFGKHLSILEKCRKYGRECLQKMLLSGNYDEQFKKNKKIFDDSMKSLQDIDSRCYISMACGTGKSYQMFLIDKEMKNKKTLVLVPSLQLLSQTYNEFAIEYYDQPDVKFILIGSDADIRDSMRIPFLSTNTKEIKNKINVYRQNKLIVISTYQSSDNLEGQQFDFIISDEAHKTANNRISLFNFALDNNNIKSKKRLSMTATPKIYHIKDKNNKEDNDDEEVSIKKKKKTQNKKEDNDEEVSIKKKKKTQNKKEEDVEDEEEDEEDEEYEEDEEDEEDEDTKNYQESGMNNEKIYGKEVFKYQLGRAIDDGRLTPYELSVMAIEDEVLIKYKEKNNRLLFKETEVEFHYLACAIMIKDMFESGKIKHLLTYHSEIKYSKGFSELLRKIMSKDVYIDHMDGSDSARKRNKIIDQFKNADKSIITSSRVLNEGVNIPEVDSVCFVESRSSVIDIVQCVGRCLRIHPGKKISKILVPVLESELKDSNFGNMTQIIKNLGQYDEVVKEFIMGAKDKQVVRKIIGGYNHSENTRSLSEIGMKDLEGRIKEYILVNVYKWDTVYEEIKKFLIENNGRYPNKKNINEKFLEDWCRLQRKYNKKGCLLESKKLSLDKLKGWIWDVGLTKFKKRLNEVAKFIEDNGRYPNAGHNKSKNERTLGNWVVDRRREKKILSEKKIKLLESLPNWAWNGDKFMKRYEESKKFLKDNGGRYPLYKSKNKEERSLANWQYKEKEKYRIYQKKIKSENGIDNDDDDDDVDNDNDENDDENDDDNDDDVDDDKKCKDHIDLLEKLPGWSWESQKDKHKKMYKEYSAYWQKNGFFPKKIDEKNLYKWAESIHSRYAQNKLSDDKIQDMEYLNSNNYTGDKNKLIDKKWVWEVQFENLIKRCDEFTKFVIENKGRYPNKRSSDSKERSLGNWRCGQLKRENERNAKGTNNFDEEKKIIEKIPSWTW